MKPVTNWYFKLRDYEQLMKEWIEELKKRKDIRPVVWKTIDEFLKPPVIYIKREFEEKYLLLKDGMPAHNYLEEKKKPSFTIEFTALSDCDEACKILTENGIRYRTGKTLVPFRLTGNIEWGVPAPVMDGVDGLTVWVWPESLWAPISFTETYLEFVGRDREEWKDYWCSKDSTVYQFIGQDNIYFYGIAEPAMWMAQQESEEKTSNPPEGELQMPVIVANHHILFLDKKASSSGAVKPPMADELLDYYTPEQLRMHWLGLGLGQRSVSFMPKPFNPDAAPDDTDPVVKDGLLLSNVYNRMIRTAFYTTQKEFDGILPELARRRTFLPTLKRQFWNMNAIWLNSHSINALTSLTAISETAANTWLRRLTAMLPIRKRLLRRLQICSTSYARPQYCFTLSHLSEQKNSVNICRLTSGYGHGKRYLNR